LASYDVASNIRLVHALQTLVSSVNWHPATCRAISTRPYPEDIEQTVRDADHASGGQRRLRPGSIAAFATEPGGGGGGGGGGGRGWQMFLVLATSSNTRWTLVS